MKTAYLPEKRVRDGGNIEPPVCVLLTSAVSLHFRSGKFGLTKILFVIIIIIIVNTNNPIMITVVVDDVNREVKAVTPQY